MGLRFFVAGVTNGTGEPGRRRPSQKALPQLLALAVAPPFPLSVTVTVSSFVTVTGLVNRTTSGGLVHLTPSPPPWPPPPLPPPLPPPPPPSLLPPPPFPSRCPSILWISPHRRSISSDVAGDLRETQLVGTPNGLTRRDHEARIVALTSPTARRPPRPNRNPAQTLLNPLERCVAPRDLDAGGRALTGVLFACLAGFFGALNITRRRGLERSPTWTPVKR